MTAAAAPMSATFRLPKRMRNGARSQHRNYLRNIFKGGKRAAQVTIPQNVLGIICIAGSGYRFIKGKKDGEEKEQNEIGIGQT